ncbi:glycoside hydrolase [Rhypophila decipiens]|uniref:lytic cellulose monooxygenase (C4-dehydrogenating) n=1 Tax=Rhypophila decipiens TaxID=261697 RepID=A0AAN7B5F0_9PEZI|nr:glycoside hydrolase [Rhypophila decipiens]
MHSNSLLLAAATSVSFLADLASAHGFVTGVRVNEGTWFPGADPVWYYYPQGAPATTGWNSLNQDLGFVSPSDFGSNNIACHKSATPGKLYINANAGDSLTIYWNTWPGDSHKGPVINYLAQCNGECTNANAGSLSFTKFDAQGYSSGTWATDRITAPNNFTTTVRIPPRLRPGNYVLRHEIIALHGAGSDNGAQNYPQCLNVKIGGGGSVSLPGGTPGNRLYTRSDPGIRFNLYTNNINYPIPGPALWTGAN